MKNKLIYVGFLILFTGLSFNLGLNMQKRSDDNDLKELHDTCVDKIRIGRDRLISCIESSSLLIQQKDTVERMYTDLYASCHRRK